MSQFDVRILVNVWDEQEKVKGQTSSPQSSNLIIPREIPILV